MTVPATLKTSEQQVTLLKLAREIAADILPIDQILNNNSISAEQFEEIKKSAWFQQVLRNEIQAWNSAENSNERSKLKAAALIEEWLPEANARLHDSNESLSAKTELAKLLTRIAGMGLNGADITNSAERFSVTINLGGDAQLKFDKQAAPPPKLIDAEDH